MIFASETAGVRRSPMRARGAKYPADPRGERTGEAVKLVYQNNPDTVAG